LRIAASNPSSGCDTVGFVLEFLGSKFIEILEEVGSEKFRVDSSNTIDSMRTNDTLRLT
jgi:hypothetical protein